MAEKETLVIASKLKAYVKETSDLRCSASVIDLLSERLRLQLDEAVKRAKADSRKTLLDKDFTDWPISPVGPKTVSLPDGPF